MSELPKAKAVKSWTNADGIRCSEIEGQEGEVYFDADDMVGFIQTLPIQEISDLRKRAAIVAFRKKVVGMEPALAYREAIALLESFGAVFPEELRTMRPRRVSP